MPLVVIYEEVKEEYQKAAELGVALPVFCAEDRETLEAILASAFEFGKEIGVDNLPIIPAWTSRYPGRAQMTLMTACGEPYLGTQLMLSDLKILTGDHSPYRKLRVMPHLDHAFPWLDGDILSDFVDEFASVMFDASEKPFNKNIQLTAEYVQKVKGQVVVEGAVDEIFEMSGKEMKNELTTLENARQFLHETGVDILVPNVGTEHRSTANKVSYQSERARDISSVLGTILCLHGTSSLRWDELHKLPGDGFVKINIYTTLAVHGGQAVAAKVIDNLGNIFNETQLKALIKQHILREKVLSPDYGETKISIKPKLNQVANPLRRDAWFTAVKNRCKEFLEVLNYKNYA